MDRAVSLWGGDDTPAEGFIILFLGDAKAPSVETLRDPKRRSANPDGSKNYVTVVQCECGMGGTYERLGDGRCIRCPECGTLIARWGRKIIAGNWKGA